MSGLPTGWVDAKIRDLFDINPGHKGIDVDGDLEVSFVPMPSIEEKSGKLNPEQVKRYSEVKSGYSKFIEDDVVFAKLTPCMENGKVAIAKNLKNGIGCGTTELHVFRPIIKGSNCYLLFFLLQESVREAARQSFQGTSGHLRVPVGFFDEIAFPLPPLSEQRRMVAKLEILLGKIDVCQQRLAKIPVILKRFRETVLASACSGRLTADWRQTHGRSQGEELPDGWRVCSVGDVGKVCNGSTPSRKCPGFWNGTIPWVSSGEVRNNFITTTRESISKEGYENSSVRLLPAGTVLLAMIGEGKTRGQTAILEMEATINQNVAAVIIDREMILSRYLWYWFRQQYETTRQSGGGSGPQALNCKRVRELPLNLPPLPEQREIVRRLDALFTLADQLDDRHAKGKTHVDRLTQSILAKAFRGELVPQDESDEPASVLLERICAQREQAVPAKRRGIFRRNSGRKPPEKKPAPEVSLPLVAETPSAYNRNVPQIILTHMKPGIEYSRSEITDATGITAADWTWAIRQLKEEGKVVQVGERRGARYLTNFSS